MLLSRQQKYILQILDALGCIRMTQLQALMKNRFSIIRDKLTEEGLLVMVRQMCGECALCLTDDLLRRHNAKADPLLLDAIDLMLELTDGKPERFSADTDPRVLLHFTAAQDYTIMRLTPETLSLPLSVSAEPEERILWLSESLTPEMCQRLPEGQFFARRGEDGQYHFYR